MTLKKNNPLRLDVSYLVKDSPGTHKDFDFSFPQLALNPDLVIVDVNGMIAVSTTEDGVVAEGNLSALTQLYCSRCLEDYWQPIKIEFTEIFSSHPVEDNQEDLGEQPLPSDGYLDLTPLINDYASLDIPIRQLCKEDCKGLCPTCGQNLNIMDCGHKQESIDPRFEGLKELLKDKDTD
jgi:uncharacterized protein